MKFSSAVAVSALAGFVAAQDISSIPSCALPCISDAVTKDSSCTISDIACMCKNIDAIQAGASTCVLSACGDKAADVLTAVQNICKGSGSSGSSSAAAPGSSSAAAPGSSAAATTGSGSKSSAAASPTGTSPSTTGSAPSNGTVTTAPPVQVTNAAGQLAAGAGSFVAAGVALLAAL